MKQIVFEIQGEAVGKGRPRFTHGGHTYTPERTRLYERKVRRAYMEAGGTMFVAPIHIDIEAVSGIQASATKAARARRLSGDELSIRKPDIDNFCKIILDALNGLAYQDDVGVVSVRVIKGRYESEPRLIVRVRETSPAEVNEIHGWLWDEQA